MELHPACSWIIVDVGEWEGAEWGDVVDGGVGGEIHQEVILIGDGVCESEPEDESVLRVNNQLRNRWDG